MGLIETEETNKFTFEAFAAHPFYVEVNRSLVRQALAHLKDRPLDTPLTIVDMACGTGAVTRLIAEEIVCQGRRVHLIGVDPSAEALRRAEKGMEHLDVDVDFIQGESTDLPGIVHNVDAVFFCNAIHLVADKLAAFQEVASILAPGGFFACNSAFYEGTYVEGTERFYQSWTFKAVRRLRKEHPGTRLSRGEKAMARQFITPQEYMTALHQAGFSSVETLYEDAIITLDAWKDLGRYWLFIEGALPGAPLAEAAEALSYAVYQVGEEFGITAVPRRWLQMVATKA
ncbi:MAG TPA: methyltransferase domain-containing protein [Ktedonobacteraceae bacterium]|nr:methyltransferase domain-containing protein [Ktedonobacteraceae bacterium]